MTNPRVPQTVAYASAFQTVDAPIEAEEIKHKELSESMLLHKE